MPVPLMALAVKPPPLVTVKTLSLFDVRATVP